jgi:hypothetical protein
MLSLTLLLSTASGFMQHSRTGRVRRVSSKQHESLD